MATQVPAQELSSWKEISAYLGVSIKTAQLWEQQRGLPVHRLPGPRGRVYAKVDELDAWKGGVGPTAEASPTNRRRLILVAVLAVAVLVTIAMRPRAGGPVWLEDIRPLTTTAGLELHPSLSPDGTKFAYVRISAGHDPELCIQDMATGSVQLVDSVIAGTHARWSPDSSLLAYSRGGAGGAEIVIRDKTNHQRVLTILQGENRKSEMLNALVLDWLGPDELVISDRAGAASPLSLVGIHIESGKHRVLTTPKEGPGDVQPAVGGHYLAFARYESHSEGDVYLLDLDTGKERRITTDHARLDGIAWIAGTEGLAVGSTRDGPEVSLYHLTLNGKMTRLSGVEGTANFPTLSQNTLLFQSKMRDTNLWEYAGTTRAVAVSTRMEAWPALGPDGNSVAFISKRSGFAEVWLQTDKALLQLTQLKQHYTDAPRWSPDGRTIAFTAHQDGNRDIYLVDIATTAVRRLTTEPGEEGRASFSRDGKTIYFRSNRSGSEQIWKQSLDGTAVQLTQNGGYEAFESTDGTEVYYIKARNRPELWKVPVTGGSEVLAHRGVTESSWSIAEDGIYVLRATAPPTILRWSPATDVETPIFTLPSSKRLEAGFSVSKDAKRMVWSQVDRHESDILQATVRGTSEQKRTSW